MTGEPLTGADRELLARAEAVLRDHYHPDRHTTGAALRTASGAVYAGVSVKGGTPKSDLHAEPVALARALLDGHGAFDAVAAVQTAEGADHPEEDTRIVSACGVCRELLVAHAPSLWVVLPGEEGEDGEDASVEDGEGGADPRKRRLSDLLPA